MKTYTGKIVHDGEIRDVDRVVSNGTKALDLNASLRVVNHSPTGFCWGYNGSGPAQLALAILLDYLGDRERALSLYQEFKSDVISGLDIDKDFVLTGQQVEDAITKIDVRRMRES